MASKVLIAVAAERDRDETLAYLADTLGERTAAREFLDALDHVIERLAEYPLMYPLVNEPRLRRMGYRKAACTGYLVLYRTTETTVLIARIVHQRQDYARLL